VEYSFYHRYPVESTTLAEVRSWASGRRELHD